MLQLRVCVPQLKIPCVAIKTWPNKYIHLKKKKLNECLISRGHFPSPISQVSQKCCFPKISSLLPGRTALPCPPMKSAGGHEIALSQLNVSLSDMCPVFVCVLSFFSPIWLFGTLWTAACQTPLSKEFYRQEYWNGLPCLSLGDHRGVEPMSLCFLHWQADSWPLALPQGAALSRWKLQ